MIRQNNLIGFALAVLLAAGCHKHNCLIGGHTPHRTNDYAVP